MKKIRLVQIGTLHGVQLLNLAINLEAMQDEFAFEAHEGILAPPDEAKLESGGYSEDLILHFVRQQMKQMQFNEYPIAVCELVFGEEEVFQCSDGNGAVISIVNWKERITKDVDVCLQYLIAACLLDIYYEMPLHSVTDVRGCPGDYCDKIEDLAIGLRKAEYCTECKRFVMSKLDTRIPLSVWVAIQRILDNVAKKPFCCVLMPFRDDLSKIYSMVQHVAAEKGYRCGRADDTPGVRDILDVMQEMVGRAELIIAILTNANPNVLFEVGFVYGIRKDKRMVLLLDRREEIPLYFKTRQVLQYEPDGDGLTALEAALRSFF